MFGSFEEIKEGKLKDKWVFCVHCERAYQVTDARLIPDGSPEWPHGQMLCGYSDCDGDLFMDGWDYHRTKKECQKTNWPDTPERGVVYPLYDEKK